MGSRAGIFITGGSGFLGRSLVPVVTADRSRTVFVLSRDQSRALEKLPPAPNLQVLEADLADTDRYASALAECRTVLHLAAATGKAGAADHYRVNAAGTKALVAACEKAAVQNFLFVSSIAVKFPEKKYYHYALAKELGEQAVRNGCRRCTILRPTLITGKGSPALAGLARLACLPRPLVFGSGKTMVQPIFAADLARAIGEILSADRFNGETLEMGGRESLGIEDLMMRIRKLRKGGKAAAVHWPLAPTISLLGVLEKFLSPILPLSAGQLYSFLSDGLAAPNDLFTRLSPSFLDIDQMLEESLCQ
jgi:nucleoside-diphosphate-sugar epimerase